MREPKFSDAPCFGKEFNAVSKVCRICLGNKPCQRKYYQAFAAVKAPVVPVVGTSRVLRLKVLGKVRGKI